MCSAEAAIDDGCTALDFACTEIGVDGMAWRVRVRQESLDPNSEDYFKADSRAEIDLTLGLAWKGQNRAMQARITGQNVQSSHA